MPKTNKELAVDLVIAQIQAQSVIKFNQINTGSIIQSDTVCNLLEQYYNQLSSLDKSE